MKLTKAKLKQIIKEELDEALSRRGRARPVGGAYLEATTDVFIMGTSGRFNIDITDGTDEYTLTGQLDPDVIATLEEAGILGQMR
jgi:hypothetical protein